MKKKNFQTREERLLSFFQIYKIEAQLQTLREKKGGRMLERIKSYKTFKYTRQNHFSHIN